MRKSKTDGTLLMTKFRRKYAKIYVGEAFYFWGEAREFQLSLTPYSDATPVPISNIVVDRKSMRFHALVKKKQREYVIDFGESRTASILAELIQKTNEGGGFNINAESYNDIEYSWDDDKLWLVLSDSNGPELVVSFPAGRMAWLENRHDVQSKRTQCLQSSVQFEGDVLRFHGKSIDDQKDFEHEWKLKFPNEILEPVKSLLRLWCDEIKTTT
ncbi:MAG: hypothetical protein JNK90_00840 [Planctomycetaceae bacterium]|nr:hypothetical protein [Planctomycetaceae bacterium]